MLSVFLYIVRRPYLLGQEINVYKTFITASVKHCNTFGSQSPDLTAYRLSHSGELSSSRILVLLFISQSIHHKRNIYNSLSSNTINKWDTVAFAFPLTKRLLITNTNHWVVNIYRLNHSAFDSTVLILISPLSTHKHFHRFRVFHSRHLSTLFQP